MENQINTKQTPEQAAKARQAAEMINQKNKINGRNYGQPMGKDAFLKLLVTELRHQDPTRPMQDRDFIAQMAQFSSLEQMKNVNTQIKTLNDKAQSTEAYSLLGKYVQGVDIKTGKIVRGEVSHIIRSKDQVQLMVNNTALGLNEINAVFPAKPENTNKQLNIKKQINKLNKLDTTIDNNITKKNQIINNNQINNQLIENKIKTIINNK